MSVYTWQLAACKHFFKQGSCKCVHVHPQLVFSWNNLIVSGFQDCLKVWYNRYLLVFCYSDLQRINLRSLRESGHALKTHCIFHTHSNSSDLNTALSPGKHEVLHYVNPKRTSRSSLLAASRYFSLSSSKVCRCSLKSCFSASSCSHSCHKRLSFCNSHVIVAQNSMQFIHMQYKYLLLPNAF